MLAGKGRGRISVLVSRERNDLENCFSLSLKASQNPIPSRDEEEEEGCQNFDLSVMT